MSNFKINSFAYSPTGSTAKIIEIISGNFASSQFTDVTMSGVEKQFDDNDLVIIGVPSYGGRVPKVALENISKLKGNNTPVVLVVVYGNRHYDDTLLELKNILAERGFITIAGGAFIAQHSLVASVAAGRPDSNDIVLINQFAKDVESKIANATEFVSIDMKGNMPYKKYEGIPLKPVVKGDCNKCGKCVRECPSKAIDENINLDKKLCDSCMKCISVCPKDARKTNWLLSLILGKMLKGMTKEVKQPETFI